MPKRVRKPKAAEVVPKETYLFCGSGPGYRQGNGWYFTCSLCKRTMGPYSQGPVGSETWRKVAGIAKRHVTQCRKLYRPQIETLFAEDWTGHSEDS